MRCSKWMLWMGLALGVALPGASTLSAQDWRDVAHDRRDIRRDYVNVDSLRAQISRDQWKLNEDIRCRRWDAVRWDRQQLARDQYSLDAQLRDIRHDRRDLREDHRDRDYRDSYYRQGYR